MIRGLLTAHGNSKISGQEAVSNAKAETIYRILDANPEVYQAVNHKSVRSRMNICFRVKDAVTEKEFLEGAEARKLLGLKGHRVRISGILPLLNRALSQKTCLGSVHSLDMVSKLAILPQTGNTDSEIVIQSVGGIRCVDSVFLTFDDGKANAMTQGKQLQCSKFFPPSPFFHVPVLCGVARHVAGERNSRDIFHDSCQIPYGTC